MSNGSQGEADRPVLGYGHRLPVVWTDSSPSISEMSEVLSPLCFPPSQPQRHTTAWNKESQRWETHVTPHIKAPSRGVKRAGLSLPAPCEWESPGLCLFQSLLAFDHEADADCIKRQQSLQALSALPDSWARLPSPGKEERRLEGRFASLAHLEWLHWCLWSYFRFGLV